MKRKELEQKLIESPGSLITRIEAAPLPAFFAGIALGVMLVVFKGAIVPLALIVALILGGIWFFGDHEGSEKAEDASESVEVD